MGDIINFRQARKRIARKAAEEKAAGNRALHGRNKAEKQRQRQEAERLTRRIDGARREGGKDNEKADRKDED